jgi:hypothetical protein
MAFNLKATLLTDRVETADKVIRDTLAAFWSGQIQPSGSTGDVARERANTIDTLGRMTKTIVGWGVEQLPVRGVFAANETVATSLAMEPKVTEWAPAITGPLLPRWLLLSGMSDSKNLLFWTRGQRALPNALAQAIRTDPNPYVRLEALRAVGVSPVPVSWVPILLDAITRADETLSATPFGVTERRRLAVYLRTVQGKLQEAAAQAAYLAAQSRPANTPEPTIGVPVALAPGKPKADLRPWLAFGASVAALAGVVAVVRRRQLAA